MLITHLDEDDKLDGQLFQCMPGPLLFLLLECRPLSTFSDVTTHVSPCVRICVKRVVMALPTTRHTVGMVAS
jgi:hypothetical protein